MSFSLFMPRLELAANESYELCPGHTLRRATIEEANKIREFVGEGGAFGSIIRTYYESGLVKNKDEHLLMSRPDRWWKYCVIHFEGSNSELRSLEFALDFLPIRVVLPITCLESGGMQGFTWNCSYLGHDAMPRLMSLNAASADAKFPAELLPSVQGIYDALKSLKQDNPRIRPFQQFHSLKNLPFDSDAYVLGLFSVIEMILTHKPTLNLHDSLTHQVSQKMNLLSKRFMKNGIYEVYPGIERVKLWKELYGWRSKIAHGDKADFKKELKGLESAPKARLFLDLNVRLLLKATVDEPELIADLKSC